MIAPSSWMMCRTVSIDIGEDDTQLPARRLDERGDLGDAAIDPFPQAGVGAAIEELAASFQQGMRRVGVIEGSRLVSELACRLGQRQLDLPLVHRAHLCKSIAG